MGLAGEAPPRDAELVTLGVLHDRPTMAAQTVIANDCRAERDQFVDSRRVRINQVDVDAVLRALSFGDLVEVPGGFFSRAVGTADCRELSAAAGVKRPAEGRRPEAGRAQDVHAIEGEVADSCRHDPIVRSAIVVTALTAPRSPAHQQRPQFERSPHTSKQSWTGPVRSHHNPGGVPSDWFGDSSRSRGANRHTGSATELKIGYCHRPARTATAPGYARHWPPADRATPSS